MEVDVFNMQGEKVRTVELPSRIFEANINVDLMHQAYTRQMANARLGSHDTKTRGDVSGGGKKPWKQKGTGRARQGSTRAPHWVGGGRAHAPHPRSYVLQMPRKMRQAALRSALSVKAKENGIVILEELVADGKTKVMAQAVSKLVGVSTALILIPQKSAEYDLVVRSAGNLASAKTLLAGYLNIRDLLGYDKLIMPLAALEVVSSHLG